MREPVKGICRLKSDSTGLPHETLAGDLCEFFDADPNRREDLQMALCRHCGAVSFLSGDNELCEPCLEKFNQAQIVRDEGIDTASIVRFNCSRPYRERWLKQRLEIKQGGKRA
jgi:hypothetical protein